MREIIIHNVTIKIGENAKENTELIKSLKNINENYIWFSGHCFRVGSTPKQRTV